MVLTKENLCTFKDNSNFNAPTEVIKMDTCCTVKSSDEEINKQFSFVSDESEIPNHDLCRNWKFKVEQYFTCMRRITVKKRVGLEHWVKR